MGGSGISKPGPWGAHLDQLQSAKLRSISSIAFGGPAMRTAFLGCLWATELLKFSSRLLERSRAIGDTHWAIFCRCLRADGQRVMSSERGTVKRVRVAAVGAGYFSQFHFDAWNRIRTQTELGSLRPRC